MSEWISVDDKMPGKNEDGLLLLVLDQNMAGGVYIENEMVCTGGLYDGEWYIGNRMMMWDYIYNLDITPEDITHWMPSPAPPTKDEPLPKENFDKFVGDLKK